MTAEKTVEKIKEDVQNIVAPKPSNVPAQTKPHYWLYKQGKDVWNRWAREAFFDENGEDDGRIDGYIEDAKDKFTKTRRSLIHPELKDKRIKQIEELKKFKLLQALSANEKTMLTEEMQHQYAKWLDTQVEKTNLPAIDSIKLPEVKTKIDFSNTIWNEYGRTPFPKADVDFSNFIFPNVVCFSSSSFSFDVDFTLSIFYKNADFALTFFAGQAIFISSSFLGGANFSSAAFPSVADFSSTIYNNYANFVSANFYSMTIFELSIFSARADFSSAKFGNNVTTFASTIFSDTASFNLVTFSAPADFSSSVFFEKAYFNLATFSKEAKFPSTTFSKEANFSSSTFSELASFHSAHFSGETDFDSSTFHKEGFFELASFAEINLHKTDFQDDAMFRNAIFQSVPDVSGLKVEGILDLIYAQWPDEKAKDSDPNSDALNYSQIKRRMQELHLHDHEIFFFRKELLCKAEASKRKSEALRKPREIALESDKSDSGNDGSIKNKKYYKFLDENWRTAQLIYLYDAVCKCGDSVARPVSGLIGLFFMMALIYPFIVNKMNIKEGLYLSASHTFPFLLSSKTTYENVITKLYGVDLNILYSLLSGFQTFISMALIFLIGLCLRNYLRIK